MSKNHPSNDLRAQILASVAGKRSPTRADVRTRALVVLAAGLVFAVAMFLSLGGVLWGERPMPFVLHTTLAWTAVFVLASVALLRRGPLGLGAPTSLLLTAGVAVAPLLGSSYVALHASEAAGIGVESAGTHPMCFVVSVVFSLAPFAFFAALRRGTDPVHPRAMGALAGAASAAFGGAAVTLHCPIATDMHVVLGHALPSAVMVVVGLLIGPVVFGMHRLGGSNATNAGSPRV